jgi:DNA modification methylase
MTPYYEDASVRIFHGDCREILPQLDAVDHVITDPPYDDKTHAGARTGGDGSVILEIGFAPVNSDVWFVPLMLQLSRRWVLCFCSLEQLGDYRNAAGEMWVRAGFWRRPDGAPQFTGDRPGQPGEGIAIMHRKGRKAWNGGGHHAFWEYGIERSRRCHPTQKPEALMLAQIGQFTDAGETILDPFMGSGTTLVAAKRLGRKAIGIEREKKYCDLAIERLAQGALGLEVPA